MDTTLTQTQLKENLHYDPETGIFVWKKSFHKPRIGNEAGCIIIRHKKKYRQIILFSKAYLAHRLAWFYMNGEWPSEIDHSDGNGVNNKFSNLSEVTHLENGKNQRLPSNNTSGTMGVHYCKVTGKWFARIKVNNNVINAGRFEDKKDAVTARKKVEKDYGFHPNHGSDRPL